MMIMIVMIVMREPFTVMRLHPSAVVVNPPIAIVPCAMIIVVAYDHRPPVTFGIDRTGGWGISVTGAGSVTISRTIINARRARENRPGDQSRIQYR
jgi:hypothetical protein